MDHQVVFVSAGADLVGANLSPSSRPNPADLQIDCTDIKSSRSGKKQQIRPSSGQKVQIGAEVCC